MGGVVSFIPVQEKCGFLGNVCLEWSVQNREQASHLHSTSVGPASLVFQALNSPTVYGQQLQL